GLVAPAVFVEGVEGDVPVERAAEAAVLRVDGPAAERAPERFELGAGEIEAALRVHGERPSEGIEAEDRIGPGNDVDAGDGGLWNEIPADRVSEPVIEAHAVEIHRQADGAARQRGGQKTAIRQVVLPGIALIAGGIDGAEVAVERVRQVEAVLVLDLL